MQFSAERQGVGVLDSVRDHYQTRCTRLGNAMRGHLSEFGIVFPKTIASLKRNMPLALEDAENGLPHTVREALNIYWLDWNAANAKVLELKKSIDRELAKIPTAKELLKLEGIGPVCTTQLLLTLGDGRAFKYAKEAAAYTGVSPQQYSTGGKVAMIGIGKYRGHGRLRANLIQGARGMINSVKAREPKSDLDRWFLGVIERRGENRAAVALANKNVRRAWTIIAHIRQFVSQQPFNVSN